MMSLFDSYPIIKSPLNYTGGKYKLLPQLLPLFPQNINTFVDLFAGGCNVGVNAHAKKNNLQRHYPLSHTDIQRVQGNRQFSHNRIYQQENCRIFALSNQRGRIQDIQAAIQRQSQSSRPLHSHCPLV